MARIRSLLPLGLTPALLCLGAASVKAASFPCGKASTPQEKAICADAALSQLDEQLAATYQTVRKQLSAQGAAEVQADQREWVRWLRSRCPGKAEEDITPCLKAEYSLRRERLQKGTLQLGGMLFFPRLKVLVVPEKQEPPLQHLGTDPGFGVGRFSWPEIDHPTPQHVAWNAAVRARAVELSRHDATDFVAEAADESDVDITYTVDAANDTLISVTLWNYWYGYGAAHPNENFRIFSWLPQKQRALQAQDFFRPASGWEVLIAHRSQQQAVEQLRQKGMEAPAPQEKEALRVATDPGSWAPGPQQLTTVFPEYSLTPRAFGLFSVSFPWDELRPYLAAGFDPATLPERRGNP